MTPESTDSPEEQAQTASDRPLAYEELEDLADRIIERMKNELRLDLEREGRIP